MCNANARKFTGLLFTFKEKKSKKKKAAAYLDSSHLLAHILFSKL